MVDQPPLRSRHGPSRFWASMRLSFASSHTAPPPEYSEVETSALSEDDKPPVFSYDDAYPTSCAEHVHTIDDTVTAMSKSGKRTYPRPRRGPTLTLYHTGSRLDPSGFFVISPQFSLLVDHTIKKRNLPADHNRLQHLERTSFSPPTNKNDDAWVRLDIYNTDTLDPRSGNVAPNPASRRSRTPHILGGSIVHGAVELVIPPGESRRIEDISLLVRGKVSTGSGHYFMFCEAVTPLWSRSFNAPGTVSARQPTFSGSHTLPFQLPFPTHVDLANRSLHSPASLIPALADPKRSTFTKLTKAFSKIQSTTTTWSSATDLPKDLTSMVIDGKRHPIVCPLPQSSTQMTVPVKYEVVLKISHGLMRPQTVVRAHVNYIPPLLPPPLSAAKKAALRVQDKAPLPHEDPVGWLELSPFHVRGRVLIGQCQKNVSITYKLFIAKPLSYTRGTSIDLIIAIKSATPGSEITELFASPATIKVQLGYRLGYISAVAQDQPPLADGEITPKLFADSSGYTITPSMGGMIGGLTPNAGGGSGLDGRPLCMKTLTGVVATAQWTLIVEDLQIKGLSGFSFLRGELKLPSEMDPSSSCSIFSLQHFVQFVTPNVHSFVPEQWPTVGSVLSQAETLQDEVYASQVVEVATLRRDD